MGEYHIIKLYINLALFDQTKLQLGTKFGTKIDKAVTTSIPYVDQFIKASLMIHQARLNLVSKRQTEAIEENFLENFDTVESIFFINTLRYLEFQNYKSDEIVERLEEELEIFVIGYGMMELTRLAKVIPYYFINSDNKIPIMIRNKISKYFSL